MHPKAAVLLNYALIFGAILIAGKSVALMVYGHETRAIKGLAFALVCLWFVKTDKAEG